MATASKSSVRDLPAAVLSSRAIYFRYACEQDASRILELRRAPSEAGMLSPTTDDVDSQRKWLREYVGRHAEGTEHYFVICTCDGHAAGTVRVHDVTQRSCWWGSWILAPASPVAAVLESYLLVNFFVFERLRVEEARFRVRAANMSVARFHDAMHSPRSSSSDVSIEYRVDSDWYAALKERYGGYFAGDAGEP
jgi:GNAT acetyltransferase-like protein